MTAFSRSAAIKSLQTTRTWLHRLYVTTLPLTKPAPSVMASLDRDVREKAGKKSDTAKKMSMDTRSHLADNSMPSLPRIDPSTIGRRPQRASRPSVVEGARLNLAEATLHHRDLYDKVVLLVQHGETIEDLQQQVDRTDPKHLAGLAVAAMDHQQDELTGRGAGQALDLSRQTAAYCNRNTGLEPELFVVAPRKRTLATAFLAFPYDTPLHSHNNALWICHPDALGHTEPQPTTELTAQLCAPQFRGVDFSMFGQKQPQQRHSLSVMDYEEDRARDSAVHKVNGVGQSEGQAERLFNWMKERKERVVVVSCDVSVMSELTSYLEPTNNIDASMKNGELRAYGIHFTR